LWYDGFWPLFLEPDWYERVPLESPYGSAFEAVPTRWQAELETDRSQQSPGGSA
jgi:hypothetical protein